QIEKLLGRKLERAESEWPMQVFTETVKQPRPPRPPWQERQSPAPPPPAKPPAQEAARQAAHAEKRKASRTADEPARKTTREKTRQTSRGVGNEPVRAAGGKAGSLAQTEKARKGAQSAAEPAPV